MSKKIIPITLFFFLSLVAYGQVKIIDSVGLLPIASANLFDEKGNLVGISNADGEINVKNLHKGKQLTLQHISYNSLVFIYQPSVIVHLSNRVVPLVEVRVTANKKCMTI